MTLIGFAIILVVIIVGLFLLTLLGVALEGGLEEYENKHSSLDKHKIHYEDLEKK